jgi:hypothetical protein
MLLITWKWRGKKKYVYSKIKDRFSRQNLLAIILLNKLVEIES